MDGDAEPYRLERAKDSMRVRVQSLSLVSYATTGSLKQMAFTDDTAR